MKSQKQHKMPTEEGPERSRGVSVGVQVHGVWRGSEEHVVPAWGHRAGLNLSCWEANLNGVTAVNVRHAAFVTPPSPWHPGRYCRSRGCVATCCDLAGDADPAAPFFVLHIGNHGSLLP